MPSTYTLNNGIELIGTGEQSGTWGDTTNTNLQLLDTALDGQVTVTLASAGSSGSPNTLPISDGAASNGRNRMVIFNDGGDLGATAYVQLTPNDAEKIIYVRNSLSGSRSILLFQGTYNASNDYEVPAGTTAVIYFDGAGTGAVAANVFNNAYFDSLRLGSVSVTAILDEDNMASDSATALATQQSIKAYVDTQVGANNELSEVLANGNTTGGTDIVVSSGDQITTNTINETTAASGVTIDGVVVKDGGITVTADVLFGDNDKAIFGAGSDLQIYHDGSNSYVSDFGTGVLALVSNNQVNIQKEPFEVMATFVADGAVTLFHDNVAKFSTTATGADVTGTLSSDGLAVGGSNFANTTYTGSSVNLTGVYTGLTSDGGFAVNVRDSGYLQFSTSNNERMRIDSSGNVGIGTSSPSAALQVVGSFSNQIKFGTNTSVYTDMSMGSGFTVFNSIGGNSGAFDFRDDGASRMFIDSSGNVGIGTSSPATLLHLNSASDTYFTIGTTNATADARIQFRNSSGTDAGGLWYATSSNSMQFRTNSAERMRIDSSGNVGIGTSSPSSYNANIDDLVVYNAASGGITIATGTSSQGAIAFADGTSGSSLVMGRIRYDHSNNSMDFRVNNDQKMTIDSSGNLLVGKTSADYTTAGVMAEGDGTISAVKASVTGVFNRLTSDGDIVQFRKDGTTVGSIKCRSSGGNLQIDTVQSGIDFGGDGYLPMRNGAITDNSLDIGSSSFRYQDIYATNGTIQTSDQNEKQQIAALTDAEITAAKAISKLFKTFKWNDSVTEKGDAARTHAGVIAQEVEQAMTDAGLNAGDYAFFISSDWTDEETGEERNRKGIRYPQLMSFIGAATEQRLASIEARLDALEGV